MHRRVEEGSGEGIAVCCACMLMCMECVVHVDVHGVCMCMLMCMECVVHVDVHGVCCAC